MTMEFLKQNLLNTTTIITVASGNSDTVENAFDRDPNTKWETVGYQSTTLVTFQIDFPTETAIDTIFVQNHNFQQFTIYHSNTTTQTFTPAIDIASATTNNHYFTFNTITVGRVTLRVFSGQTNDTEKSMGEFYVNGLLLNMERNPSAPDYKPLKPKKDVIHKMPNGGVTQFVVDQKFKAQLKWKYLTNSFTSKLENIYDTNTAFHFVPFPTTTSWDGVAPEVLWTNDFDFRHSSNNKDAGQGGKVIIEETA